MSQVILLKGCTVCLSFTANSRIGCDHWIGILPPQLTDSACVPEVLWTYSAVGYVSSCHNWGFS